jgi:hypothetical protein
MPRGSFGAARESADGDGWSLAGAQQPFTGRKTALDEANFLADGSPIESEA